MGRWDEQDSNVSTFNQDWTRFQGIAFFKIEPSIQMPFRSRQPFFARLDLGSTIERSGEAFEYTLVHMMHVLAADDVDVQVACEIVGQRLKELLEKPNIQGVDIARRRCDFVHHIRAPGEIENDAGQGLVHRQDKEAVPADAFLVAQGILDRGTQNDAEVFHRVMGVDFQVAFGLYREVKEAVLGEQRQHMIHKRNAGINTGFAFTVDDESEIDRGLASLAFFS
jgi:hypothetical protein